MASHITVKMHCELCYGVINEGMAFYSSFLLRSSLRIVGFTFAAAVATAGVHHVTPSMSTNQIFSLLTPLVIFLSVNICAQRHFLFAQDWPLLDPFIQMTVLTPSTVTFGGWGAPFSLCLDLKYGNLSQIKIPLSLLGLSLFVLFKSPLVEREFW